MNPLKQFKFWMIGNALAKTDDVFEKAKAELLFNFTFFFLITGIIFSFGYKTTFELSLHIVGVVSLLITLFILKQTGNVRWAAYVYAADHTLQNTCHCFFGNGHIEMQAVSWLVLYAVFGYLILGKRWGFVFTLIMVSIIILALANEQSGFKFYKFPSYLDNGANVPYVVILPILLTIYLIREFVQAEQKAETQIKDQKQHVESANKELESKNKDITDSINYAQRIQYAVLPHEENIYRNIPLSFIAYKPKDIVSGDFFWFHEIDRDNYFIVCADCTGHGVPGAMMTVVGSSLLNQIVVENKFSSPGAILSELDKKINSTLKQEKERQHSVQDGMDLSLIKVDKANKKFIFTSAKRPAIFIRNKQMQEFKGSKFSLGGMRMGEKTFEEVKMDFQEDDIIYFYTDGYTDQFGGPKGKKYSSKRLKETLQGIHQLSMAEQKQKLDSTIENWKGNLEQVDDILIMGIRF